MEKKALRLLIQTRGHFIRTDLLTAGVLSNLRKVTSYAAKHEARFMKLLIEQNEDGGKRRNAAKKKELETAEKRIAELSAIFKRLYEDSVTGRISDERFTELSADYEAEQRELKESGAVFIIHQIKNAIFVQDIHYIRTAKAVQFRFWLGGGDMIAKTFD